MNLFIFLDMTKQEVAELLKKVLLQVRYFEYDRTFLDNFIKCNSISD